MDSDGGEDDEYGGDVDVAVNVDVAATGGNNGIMTQNMSQVVWVFKAAIVMPMISISMCSNTEYIYV